MESCDTHLINKHVHFKMDFQIQLIIAELYYFQYLRRALSNKIWNIESAEIWNLQLLAQEFIFFFPI